MFFRPRYILPGLLYLLFAYVLVAKTLEVRDNYKRHDKVINEDAFGYYLVLPALFKFNDPDFLFLDTTLKKEEAYKNYIPPVVNTIDNGQSVCKYFSGVAILQSPFYLFARLTDTDNGNGFEQHYHNWMLVPSIFYCLLACLILYKRFIIWELNSWLGLGILFLITLGTNLYAYITYDPGYSHVYSFFALTLLSECLIRFKESGRITHLTLGLLFYGLVVVIRPLNGVIGLLIPLFIGHELINILKKAPLKTASYSLLALFIFPGIQSFFWHWQTGRWLVYPYAGENLDLGQPQIWEFVFGFNCGWAIYTPSIFLLLVSGILLAFLNQRLKLALVATGMSTILIYLLSCWYYLHYGCTAGSRPITEFYGLIGLLFAKGLIDLKRYKSIKFTILGLLVMTYMYNRIVIYQFYNHIINWCDMDKHRLEMVFLRTHEVYNYSTYPFWDFSRFDNTKPTYVQTICDSISSGGTASFRLPPIEANDSSILITIKGKAKINDDDYYLRFLLTDKGEYVEQQTLLLQRKISVNNRFQGFDFKFHIYKSLTTAQMRVSLEKVGAGKGAVFVLDSIALTRVK